MPSAPSELLIDGRWRRGEGEPLVSLCPSSGATVWQGQAASQRQVDEAFQAARVALDHWCDSPLERRIAICESFAQAVQARGEDLALLISQEMGKPLWEARTEVATVVGKIAISIDALRSRRDTTSFTLGDYQAVTRFKPIGVMAVLGPFNFPAHLPNGHIVPALLAGNTIVFKPSELTPAVGAWMAQIWHEVGLPAGVLNVVQGGSAVGIAVSRPDRCDGLLFTGSGRVGRALHRAFAEYPQKILALEMGGNNPLVVDRVADLHAAAYQTVLSAFVTAGQRCTCARRLILVAGQIDVPKFIGELQSLIGRLQVGYYSDPSEPFCGPVISPEAGWQIFAAYQSLLERGGRVLAPLQVLRDNPALLSPALVDVCEAADLEDEEVFGPLLNLFIAPDLDAAIRLANNTKYGLSAGLLSDDADRYQHFIRRIRAGIVNWNRQTTGASGKLPFGGCGLSGNHRPAGYFSADYCSYPVASLESAALQLPIRLEPGIRSADDQRRSDS